MNTFPNDTRHRNHQMVTFDDMNHIARKFLATQVPKYADWQAVYPFVANDLESIQFRAPNVLSEYANFREIDPNELEGLVQSSDANLKAARKMPVFQDFCERVNPPPGKELVAFFLHGQCKKNLAHHVETLFDEADQRRMLKAIREYAPPKELQGIESSLGLFLANMQLESPVVLVASEELKEEEEEEKDDESAELGDDLVILSTPDAKQWNDQEHWENPILKAFKAEAGLSTKFSCEKTAKQMLVAHCAPCNYTLPNRKLLGKFQSEIPGPITSGEAVGDCFPPLLMVDSLPSETIESIIAHPSAQLVYQALKEKPKDNREWVKNMIQSTAGAKLETHRRYTLPEKLHPDIVEKIINNVR